MLFPEEDAPLLKNWIVKRIEDTSDADSEVLAEYIIALLKHEGSKEEVRKLCEAEIPDFLTEDPAKFLDDVFRTIAYKSYVPGAAPPPPTRAQGAEPVPAGAFGGKADARHANGMPPRSRKRGYADLDAPQEQYHQSQNPRPMKNPRWNGPQSSAQGDMRQGDYQPMALPMPIADSANPMAAFMNMDGNMPMGWPAQIGGQFGNGGRGGRKKKNRRCRDFDTKGYCARGARCNYEHGHDGGLMPSMGNMGGDYNPDDPNITLADPQAQFNPWSTQSQNNSSRGRTGKRGRNNRRRGGARAAFSKEGPETDTSKSTIVVESIPEENFTEDEVRSFFSTFGEITEISMHPYKRLAVVKYDTWDSANAAYLSPKVIFDNRFVKVFWYRDESQIAPPHANGDKDETEAEPFDPEEFARKQEEAQKAYQEKETKRAEVERQRQELEKKQQELLERHKAESAKLQNKLLSKNGSTPTDTNPLRAQLALLEQEAKMLGLDPDAAPMDDELSVSSWSTARGGWRGRGQARGRGRGRGRGRASFRGVDDRHAAYSRYSLDLRPRRVAISGADFTDTTNEEALKHLLLNLGEFDSVEPTAERTVVTLGDRKTAERLYASLHGKALPGVEGDLTLEYLPNIPGTLPTGNTYDASTNESGTRQGEEAEEADKGMVIDADADDEGSEEGEVEDDAMEDEDYERKTRAEDDDAY